MSTQTATSSKFAAFRSVATTLGMIVVVLSAVAIFATGSPLSGTAPSLSGKAMDGSVVRLDSLRGKPVVLYFWATWCTACKLTSPTVDGFAGRHPDVPVLAVAADDLATVRAYLNDEERHFTVLADGQSIARALGIRAYPTTAIVDAEGQVVWSRQGVLLPGELDLRLP